MITKVMPSLRKCLSDNGYDFDEGKGDGKSDGSRFRFLIAVGGELFESLSAHRTTHFSV